MKKQNLIAVLLVGILMFMLAGCQNDSKWNYTKDSKTAETSSNTYEDEIQGKRNEYLTSLCYKNKPATEVNGNKPYFAEDGLLDAVKNDAKTFLEFSNLDEQKRTKMAYALLNKSMMPNDDSVREEFDSVKPTGWIQAKYDWIDNGGWLYNRCHLIAWSLTGENANEKNLMTGTRYFNVEGMLPYEIKTIHYLNENPNNHVLYRATPIYSENELLARGLLLEAYSIEDDGKLTFCVYIHNVEPGVEIDYATGKNFKKGSSNEKAY